MSDMVEILRGLGMDDIAEEIERLRARIVELEAHCDVIEADDKTLRAIAQRQDAAIERIEAQMAVLRGTLSQTQTQGPEAFGVTYDVTSNVPR